MEPDRSPVCAVARVGGTKLRLSRVQLDRAAREAGFQPEPLEKVPRLLELLQALAGHPFLKERLALKGGTAVNLFALDVPRLSVDVGLNDVLLDRDREFVGAEKLRLAFVVYGAASRGDWRTISAENVRPELLADDDGLQRRIHVHPALHWKALNVRRHRDHSASIDEAENRPWP